MSLNREDWRVWEEPWNRVMFNSVIKENSQSTRSWSQVTRYLSLARGRKGERGMVGTKGDPNFSPQADVIVVNGFCVCLIESSHSGYVVHDDTVLLTTSWIPFVCFRKVLDICIKGVGRGVRSLASTWNAAVFWCAYYCAWKNSPALDNSLFIRTRPPLNRAYQW